MLSGVILKAIILALSPYGARYMDLITKTPSELYPNVWNAVFNVYRNFSLPVAIGLMVIYFLISLGERQIELGSEITIQTLVKPLMGFILGITILLGGSSGGKDANAMIAIMNWNQGLTNSVVSLVGIDEDNAVEDKEALVVQINEITKPNFAKVEINAEGEQEIVLDEKYKLLEGLDIFIGMGINAIIMWAIGIGVQIILYGRLFEIYIRLALAPLAMSDMFVKGKESTGFRYIKDFASLLIQGVLIILVFHIFSLVPLDNIGSNLGIIEKITARSAMYIALWGLLSRTRSISKSLLGLN